MPPALPISLNHPWVMTLALIAVLIALCARWVIFRQLRRPDLILIISVIILSFAMGEPIWRWRVPGNVIVMVDLSPSTRGAAYRDVGFLRNRLTELLSTTPFRAFGFASTNKPLDLTKPLQEMLADNTQFNPPLCDTVILFSDGRFASSQNQAVVFPVVDPGLENVLDARVADLRLSGEKVEATISNSGPDVLVRMTNVENSVATFPTGTITLQRHVLDQSHAVNVRIDGSDLWPENDAMSIGPDMPWKSQRWWVGDNPPDGSWRKMRPQDLPENLVGLTPAAQIVLENIPAKSIDLTVQNLLKQYVQDLGGTLVILGGDRAFGAGGAVGSELDELSPLASSAPKPQRRWTILIDCSGSMNDATDGITRFTRAVSAAQALLKVIPPNDRVDVGGFSDWVRWWRHDESAQQAAHEPAAPPDASPHGPTNLQAALQAIASAPPDKLPDELLVLSDCEASLHDIDALSEHLRDQHIAVSALVLGDGSAAGAMSQIARTTGGQIMARVDPRDWARALVEMGQSLQPGGFIAQPAKVSLNLPNGSRTIVIARFNRVWLRDGATVLGSSDAGLPVVARWHSGLGEVLSAAFSTDSATAKAITDSQRVQRGDARFVVSWLAGQPPSVRVDAWDGVFLNSQHFSVRAEERAVPIDLPQIAPGRYELALPESTQPRIAQVFHDEVLIATAALPGKYPQEFEAIGNDRVVLRELAKRSGGRMIEPADDRPIHLSGDAKEIALSPWLFGGGALLAMWALVNAAFTRGNAG